ncbi:hypothetical protein NQ318_017715 [Aromia moschata]|uniref:Uncharacterized protein n=1 Tax=Aromia moschata TaxID=1265417 RepID=A0AAV8XQ34_9CUCU|nr:hypothetical protein NQ318_017715 [Aromia moschata]
MITKEEFLEGEDNLVVLSSKIKVAVSLLEILANRSPKSMENTGSNTDSLISPDNSTSDGKTIQKFTLRPPRVYFSRPDSPDSPSVDINETNTPEIQQDYCSSTKEYVSWSADPRISQDVSCNIDDSYHTAYDDSFRQAPFELISQDGFPNMSDAFLEELGLHESSPKQILSKEETERLFTTFAIQIVLDSKDIKERLQKQKEQCAEQYEKMLCAIKDVSLRLRDHKCIGATDSINATFVLLEDLKFLLKDVTQSIGRYGILTCENRMMKCWNLVTNYMALLKQETIKVELGQVAQTQCHVDDKTDKNTQRRRRRSIDESSGSREQKKCEKPLIPKCDTKESLPRRSE